MSNVSGLFFVKEFFVMKNLSFWFFLGSNCNVTLSKLKTLFLNSSGLTFDIFYLQFDSLFRIVQFSRYIMVESRGIEPLTSCVQGMRSPS